MKEILPKHAWLAGYTDETWAAHKRVVKAWKVAIVIGAALLIIFLFTH